MDTRNGDIRSADYFKETLSRAERERFVVPIDAANLSLAARRELERTGRTTVSRNSPCPCGSRKRFKRCCMAQATK